MPINNNDNIHYYNDSVALLSNRDGHQQESLLKHRLTYNVTLIKAGLSANNIYYSPSLLQQYKHKFNNTRVFIASDYDHGRGASADIRNLIGCIRDIIFHDNALHGTLHIMAPHHPDIMHINELIAHQGHDLFGLSIVAIGRVIPHDTYKKAISISHVRSVDLIAIPSAGGAINLDSNATPPQSLISSPPKGVSMQDIDNLKHDILQTNIMSEAEISPITDSDTLQDMFNKRIDAISTYHKQRNIAEEYDKNYINQLHQKITMLYAKDKLAESHLPPETSQILWQKFSEATTLSDSDIDRDIEAAMALHKTIKPAISGHHFSVGETRSDKVMTMFEAVLDGEYSMKDAYRQVTGDNLLTGRAQDCDASLMAEALSTTNGSFAASLGQAMHKKLLQHYDNLAQFDGWKSFTNETRCSDFRDMKTYIIGGYGTLPKVNEQHDYSALSSPSTQEASYHIAKYGGTETITMEMIANDDVRAIAQLPIKLANAAKRTLSQALFSIIDDNPAIFDGKNLYHADHSNIGSHSLNAEGLYTMRQLLMRQPSLSDNTPQYIPPKNLVVPLELERAAYDLFKRDTNNDSNFINNMLLNIIVNPFALDNSDWVLFADKLIAPTLEVAYYQGKAEPELFVQDSPQVGSLFNNDTITYKIRHIWGVGVVDYRGTVKAIIS